MRQRTGQSTPRPLPHTTSTRTSKAKTTRLGVLRRRSAPAPLLQVPRSMSELRSKVARVAAGGNARDTHGDGFVAFISDEALDRNRRAKVARNRAKPDASSPCERIRRPGRCRDSGLWHMASDATRPLRSRVRQTARAAARAILDDSRTPNLVHASSARPGARTRSAADAPASRDQRKATVEGPGTVQLSNRTGRPGSSMARGQRGP